MQRQQSQTPAASSALKPWNTGESHASATTLGKRGFPDESAGQATIGTTAQFAVTVIMANYNGERWIAEAIESVQAQSFRNWELIVVDDASTDASVKIVQALASHDPRIVLIAASRNGGPAAARNLALERVKGRWITFLDSDDLYTERRLESLLAKTEQNQSGIVADDLLIMDESGSLTGHALLGVESHAFINAIDMVERPHFAYLQPLIRFELMAGIRYDERLRSGEDLDLMIRVLAKHDASMSVYPAMGYSYRRRGGSLSTDRSASRAALKNMLDANTRFRTSYELPKRLSLACARRHRFLTASIQWVDVTEAIRERRFTTAMRHVIGHPRVLGCAVQFVRKRVDRLVPGNKRRAKTLGL